MADPQPELCTNCHQRLGTLAWIGDGGTLAWVHGCGTWWCPPCVLEAQLAYALQRAADIPRLQRELAAVRAAASPPQEAPNSEK